MVNSRVLPKGQEKNHQSLTIPEIFPNITSNLQKQTPDVAMSLMMRQKQSQIGKTVCRKPVSP